MTMSNRIRWIIFHLLDSGAPVPAPPPPPQPHGVLQIDALLLLLLLSPPAAAQAPVESTSKSPYSSFNPSLAIVIVVMVCAFFFMSLFSIYIRQCAQGTAGSGINSLYTSAAAGSGLSERGLDPAVIHSFPTFNYAEVKSHKIGKGGLECAVCINEFQDNDTLRLLPKCDHVFHPDCIDAWLASRSTCPVCRANLTTNSGEASGKAARGIESISSSDDHNSGSEVGGEFHNQIQISVNVDDDRPRDPQLIDNPKQNREQVTKFPRSHSTGHSLVQPGESCERYTLTLPEEVRKKIMTQVLKRTSSSVLVLPGEGSSRRGFRGGGGGGGEGNGRWKQDGRFDRFGSSDRCVFIRTPSLFSRTDLVMSPKGKGGVDGDVTAMGTSKSFLTSVKTSFDCLATKGEQISNRLPV